jgi:DNA-binding PadR family transcriptional regulator
MDGDQPGDRPFGLGRKLTSIDLQLIILALLADKPRHGYELIKELEQRSKGFYVPSPGMVYPALTYLEEVGHADIAAEGTRKRYHITQAGRDHLEANRARAEAMLAQFERVGARMDQVRRAMSTGGREDPGAAQDAGVPMQLAQARRELQEALDGSWTGEAAEQQRIIDVLKHASLEIRGKRRGG